MTGSARLMSGSRGFNEQDVRAAAGSVFDRAGRTAKAQRASHLGSMFAAIDCQPRWRERLGEITAPTLVIHGDEDPFFPHRQRGGAGRGDPGRHAAHTARHRPGRAARDVAGRRGGTVAPHLLTATPAQEWRLGRAEFRPGRPVLTVQLAIRLRDTPVSDPTGPGQNPHSVWHAR